MQTRFEYWHERIGRPRDWVWRGWQTRYTYLGPAAGPDGAPLLLLHGFGAAIEHWRQNLPVLGQTHRVYALDLLGFGGSRKAATNYSVGLWVDQVWDFWETFIGEPVVLVGNSIGSLVALGAAASHPERLQGLALLSLPDVSLRQEQMPKWLWPVVSRAESAIASPLVLSGLFRLLRRPGVIRRWARFAYGSREAITEELVEILAAPARDEGAARAFAALFRAVSRPDFCLPAKGMLPGLKLPILLVWGREDRMVPLHLAKDFAILNPQIQLVELAGAGHCPHDECPELFNPLLLQWLGEISTLR
ncbi:MAG: alpha/beta fold hydrolase [Chloroflexaceae bacterium]|nr:alpha/beta fold hydrolase [Chloroflexaceae bacterium]